MAPMSFEPQKFFIGLIDFFAILLPGGLLTFLVKDHVGPRLLGNDYYHLTGTNGWVAFLASSYLLGHFVFLIGAGLLDDYAYDPVRRASYGEQIKKLARGKRLSPLFQRWLSRIFFGKEMDLAVKHAVKIKERQLGPLEASNAINAFQWSKAKLTIEHPQAMEAVQRFEADSKFFRSLVILCILIIAVLVPLKWLDHGSALTWVCVPIGLLAFWRYVDQRLKATQQAYWYIITEEGNGDNSVRQEPALLDRDAPTHAGGVVYRRKAGRIECLLVQAKGSAVVEWVLPKGHVEDGESLKETAVREVREEAGTWAQVKSKLANVTFPVKGNPITVRFYLMEQVDRTSDVVLSHAAFLLRKLVWWKEQDRRECKWLPLAEAQKLATYSNSKDVLLLAEQRLTSSES